MSPTVIFFTDRSPMDKDPFSFWLWESVKERAKAGSRVLVYTLREMEESTFHPLSPGIQIRSGLAKGFQMHSFVRSLLEANPSTLCFVEPKWRSFHWLSLMLIPGLKTVGLLNAEIATLFFSATVHGLPMKSLATASDVIHHTHPYFIHDKKIRSDLLNMDPGAFQNQAHWSLSEGPHLKIIPSSLGEVIAPSALLDECREIITRNPGSKFLFLEGIGRSSDENKNRFLTGPLASHFLFPDSLSGEQMGYALFHFPVLWTNSIKQDSPLAGLALRITMDKSDRRLDGTRVYGLL